MQKNLINKNQTKKQVAGGFLSVEWCVKPSLAESYIKEAAEANFYAYILFVRQMKQTVIDTRVHDAVAVLADLVHKYKMKFVLDTDPTHWGIDLIQEYPETALWCIVPVSTCTSYGKFKVFGKGPGIAMQIEFQEIAAAYIKKNNKWKSLDSSEIEYNWQSTFKPDAGIDLIGKIPDNYHGELILYLAISTTSLIDHAHPLYLKKQKEILDLYSDIKLDGVAWDEPGKGHGSLTTFRAGEGFLQLFKETNSYDLREKLIFLDHFSGTSEAVKVRCDYYRTLSDMNYQCQYEHNDYAKKIWGNDIICGTHQTWSGLPSDLAAGVFDHFRLGKLLTGAWTDGGINLERKCNVFPLMLADSLKKELHKGDAYYNDWSYSNKIELFRFFNRFKTLFQVNAFTHVYSKHSESLVNLRFAATKKAYEDDLQLQDGLNTLIGERLGDTDVAIWYGWEGYASLPKWCTRAVYTFFQNTSLFLTDSGLFSDFVSSEAIENGLTDNSTAIINNNKYKIIIVPYAHALPIKVYEQLLRASQNGVKVVFTGPIPEFTANGRKIDFCNELGIEQTNIFEFERALSNFGVKISPDAWEPAYLDVICPVSPISAQITRNINEEIITVKAKDKELYWLPSLDPRDDLINLIQPWCCAKIEVFSPNAYYRTFSLDNNPDDFVLVLAPREGVPGWGLIPSCYEDTQKTRPCGREVNLKALIKVGENEFKVNGAQWCAIHFKNGKVLEFLADDHITIS